MKTWLQISFICLAAAMTAVAGIYHGNLTNRWGPSPNMEIARSVLHSLPSDIGPWQLEHRSELSPEVIKILQCAGNAGGEYVNSQTRERVTVSAIAGPPGPTSVHRPEICLPSVNFPLETQRQRVVIRSEGSVEDSAWMVQFKDVKNPAGGLIRVYYAWSDGGPWTASEEPRVAFGTRPYLFKVQIMTVLPETASTESSDPARSFLSDFIPVFQSVAAKEVQKAAEVGGQN